MAGFFKTGLPSIFRKSGSDKPDAGALARHFSTPVERHLPPPLPEPEPIPAAIRATKPAPPKPTLRSKLLFAFDGTWSREPAWQTAIPLTDSLLGALPDQLDVALAGHGG